MPRLKIRFDEPEHGWIGLFIEYDEQTRQYNASYAGLGSNAFPQLINALLSLTDYQGSYYVDWYYNPDYLRMTFTREVDLISLVINHHNIKHYNVPNRSETWLSTNGSYSEICLPFWRALRALQGRYSQEEWTKGFHAPFPFHELDSLTQQLGKT